MVGRLKGIGRVYLHAVVDTHGSYAFGFVHVSKQPEAAVAVLHNDVLPFYRKLAYDFGELDELVLAYATTVHKAQGSEYPAAVIPVTTQHYPMPRRNLLYTGVTRGRKLVVLVAPPKEHPATLREGVGQAMIEVERQLVRRNLGEVAPQLGRALAVVPQVAGASHRDDLLDSELGNGGRIGLPDRKEGAVHTL